MKNLDRADKHIGSVLKRAFRVVIREEERDFRSAITLEFEDGSLTAVSMPDDDSLSVVSDTYPEWCFEGEVEDVELFRQFYGMVLANVWVCLSEEGYCDGIDFGFGDLNLPNVKLISLTSEIVELSVSRP